MPSSKTYQAIGFVIYHVARYELRRNNVPRRAAEAAVAAGVVGVAIGAAAAAARRGNGRPLA